MNKESRRFAAVTYVTSLRPVLVSAECENLPNKAASPNIRAHPKPLGLCPPHAEIIAFAARLSNFLALTVGCDTLNLFRGTRYD